MLLLNGVVKFYGIEGEQSYNRDNEGWIVIVFTGAYVC